MREFSISNGGIFNGNSAVARSFGVHWKFSTENPRGPHGVPCGYDPRVVATLWVAFSSRYARSERANWKSRIEELKIFLRQLAIGNQAIGNFPAPIGNRAIGNSLGCLSLQR
ncbi:MAG: hypothetical protein AAGN35_04885 [Bacteroidota bacterium]